jgi:hypothetical protein
MSQLFGCGDIEIFLMHFINTYIAPVRLPVELKEFISFFTPFNFDHTKSLRYDRPLRPKKQMNAEVIEPIL